MGFKAVKIIWACFRDEEPLQNIDVASDFENMIRLRACAGLLGPPLYASAPMTHDIPQTFEYRNVVCAF